MRKIFVLLLVAVLCLAVFPQAGADETPAFRGYNGKYQYVLLGNYPHDAEGLVFGNHPFESDVKVTEEPVLWRILALEDNTLLMLTEDVIELQQVTFINDPEVIDSKLYEYPVLEKWAESDICKWMNTEMIDHLFGQDPIVNAMLEEGENGKLFCMSDAQFVRSRYGWRPNKDPTSVRVASPTPYALKRRIFRDGKRKNINYKSGGSPYWCSTRTAPHRFQIVGWDGHLSAGAFTRENIGIRPSIRLDVDQVGVESGTGTKKDPFILKYTGPFPTIAPDAETEPEAARETEPEAGMLPQPEEIPQPEAGSEPEQADNGETEQEKTGDTAAAEEAAGEKDAVIPEATASREEGTALVSFLGDCSVGDAFQSAGKSQSYHSVVKREGYAWPFSEVQKYIGTDDMTVANLEIVLTTKTKHKNIVYPLRGDPAHVNILLEGSVDVLNTANNHCYDFYRDGYADTLQVLDDAGIDHFGSVYYSRKNGFDHVVVKEVNGIRFGLFGFTYPTDTDLKHAEQLIKKLQEEEHCDYIIASLHWGRETHLIPGAGNARYAKKILDLGADMIYGHHPHVLQPIAFHNNKPILFSTGNCTFGTLSSNMDQHAGIFQITFEKTDNGTVPRKLEVIPCKYHKSGDYRIEEETDEAERAKTFQILSPGRNLANCVNPPASFLSTGVILFSETGELITE